MEKPIQMTSPSGERVRWKRLAVFLLLVAVAGGVKAQVFFDGKIYFRPACVLYVSSLVLFALVAAGPLLRLFPRSPSGYRPENIFFDKGSLEPRIKPLWEVIGFIAVLAVGVFFRLYRLDAVPPGLNHDAAMHCQYSIDFLRGAAPLSPYFVPPRHYPIGYETFQPLVTAVYIHFLGVVPLASKLSLATSGIAALIVVYFFVRFVFGVRTGLIAMFFMSVCGWHFIFSRVGWHCISVPLWETIALFLLFAAIKRNKLTLFALAGAATSVNLMTYSISRILIGKEAVIGLYLWLKKVVTFRAYWKGAVVFLVVFAVCAVPVIHYALTNWTAFQGRTRMLFIGGRIQREGLAPLAAVLGKTLLNFNYRANGNDYFIHDPLLDLPLSVFFAFGFVACCVLSRRPRYGMLLIWFLMSILPGILSEPNPNHNFSALVPSLVIAAVAGDLALGSLWRWLSRFWRRAGTVLAVMAVAGALLIVCANYRWYIAAETRRDIWGLYPETRVVGEYMDTILDEYEVYVADNFPIDSLVFLTYDGGDFDPRFQHLWGKGSRILSINLRPPPGKGVAFIAKPIAKNEPIFRRLLAQYPGSELVLLRETINPKNPDRVIAKVVLIGPEALRKKVPLEKVRAQEDERRKHAPRVFVGGTVSGPGLFDNIMDIAVDGKGNIYAVDMGNNRVQKFDPRGVYLLSWGGRGSSPGEFNEPRGIAVDRRGDVYVVDTWNHRVQKFTPEGKFVSAWTSPGGLYGPRGIAVFGKRVYVADSGNNRIEVFDTKGRHRATWGKKGSGQGEFGEPVGVAVDGKGFVYVVDSANNRIQKLDRDGRYMTSWKVAGWSGGRLKENYLACDESGAVYVADPASRSVLQYTGDGRLIGTTGENLQGPTGLAVRGEDLYVSERSANRIRKEKLKGR